MYDLILDEAKIVTPAITIKNGLIAIDNGKIASIVDKDYNPEVWRDIKSKKTISLRNKILVPGFFDIHAHGGFGYDYDDIENVDDGKKILEHISLQTTSEGVTSFFPTLVVRRVEQFDDFLARLALYPDLVAEPYSGATIVGINLELFMLPGLGATADGDKPVTTIPEPTIANWEKIEAAIGDAAKLVMVAPEWADGLEVISYLRMKGIIPSIGHTLATEDILDEAIRRGAKYVTHIYNTTYIPEQNQIGVFVPGVNEYLVTRDDIMSEIIVDTGGHHIHPTVLKIIVKCLGVDNLISIGDSFKSRGTDMKGFNRDGTEIVCDGDVNRKLNGHLHGTMHGVNKIARNLKNHAGVSIPDAVKTASTNPAKLLNMYDRKGSIEVGKDADLTVINEDFDVFLTVVDGKVVFDKLG